MGFLSETKRNAEEIEVLTRRVGGYRGVYVGVVGHAGGLEMLWNASVNLLINLGFSLFLSSFSSWFCKSSNGYSVNLLDFPLILATPRTLNVFPSFRCC